MSAHSLKRARSTHNPAASSASSSRMLRPPAPTSSSSSSKSTIDCLPRVLQTYVLAFLDQVGFVATARVSRAWQALAALPASAPAALRFRALQVDRRAPYSGRIPSGFWSVLRQSAAAPATGFGGLRSLAVTMLGTLDDEETVALAGAIRALPSLQVLELGERAAGDSPSLDKLVHAIVVAPTGGVATALPSVRALALGLHLWTAQFVYVARVFTALTHLTISPGYLSCKIPYSPFDSFATLGSRRQWQNWSALSLFAHLERLTLSSKNVDWHVDVPDWELERDGTVVADKEAERICDADPAAAASLRDHSRDRRPRLAAAFSGVTELELVDWNGPSARPLCNLVRHLPRLARLVLRQCRVGWPLLSAPDRRDLVANLAELQIERTHDCYIAGGVDFALRHTDVTSVQVRGLLRRVDGTYRAACNFVTEPPYAAVCTELTSRHLHDAPNDPRAVAADALLVAASRRSLVVDYHYDADTCVCEFAAPPNISFRRHPTNRVT